ncbi:phage tail tape measure protein [Sphingobium yanoikuyae]|uniref:Phage tail tape measure protein n=1 Tax=Sphingobium yanoikuyae TaxID=13690 RepID=A0A291N6N8_SPHYA|nr:phage tail tape measure protein [Sphingobium yanoikuyae]ATI82895.1 phage tail tape measure protein [Sphingobium yanoikuyae]
MADRNLRIRVLMEGADRLTRPMREAAAGSGRLAQTLKATRDRLKDLEAAQASIGDFRQLKTGLAETERKMAQAQARTARLGRELAQTENPTKKLRAEFERARRESANLSTQHQQQSARLQELRGRLSAAGVSTRDLVAGERRLCTEVGATTEQLREQERRLQQVTDRARRFADAQNRFSRLQGTATGLAAGGMASIGTGMAIAAPLTVAVEGSMEFQSVMTDINQKVNQSREAGRLMGLDLRKAALAVNQFPADLQKGVDTLTGFGLGARQAVDMMTPIGRAATAYKAEIDDLGKATFSAHDNLKVPIEQTAKALDVMAQAGKSGAFEVKDMAQYFPELTANMQSLGSRGIPAVADLAAALQITRKGAGDAAGAATNLQNLLSKINAGDTTKNFAKFGIDVPAAMKKAAKEGRSPIEEIVRLTQQATGGDQAKLSSLFGDMQVQQALRPLMSAFSEYQSIRSEALAANGTVNTDFADRMNDDAEKVKRLQIQTKNLSTTLGDQLRPTVGVISDRFSQWGERIAAVAERHPNLTRAAAVAAGVLASLFIVVGGGAIVLAGLVAPFAALSAAATLLGIGMLPLIGITAGVMLGIGLLAGGAYLLYSNWSGITAWWDDLWTRVGQRIDAAINYLRSIKMSDIGRYLIDGLIAGIQAAFPNLTAMITKIGTMLPAGLRKLLGIHSPSRVFAAIGGHVMAGLDQGLADNASNPLTRIADLSGQMTRALAVGATSAAIAAAPVAAQSPSAQPGAGVGNAPPVAPATYNLHFHGVTGDPQDIEDAVARAIEKIERDRRGRGFGDNGD